MTDNNNKDPFLQVDLYNAAQDNRLLRPFDAQFAGVPQTPSSMLPPTATKQERLEEDNIQRAIEEGQTIIKSFGDGKFGQVTDTGSEWNRGYLAMQTGELPMMQGTGFNERNLENVRIVDAVINDRIIPNMTTSTEAYSFGSQASTVGDYFADMVKYIPFVSSDEDKADEDITKRIGVVDPEFNLSRRIAEVETFKQQNPTAYDYMRRAGIDPVGVTSSATNIDAFKYMLWESMQQAVYNRNIEHFNSSNWSTVLRGVNTFTHSPTVLRDTIALTALTLGYGTTLRLLGSSAEAVALGAEATAAARAASLAAKTVAAAQKITGPMTGLIEGPAFLLARGSGLSGARILAARTGAIALDAAAQAGFSTLGEQHRQYEWKELLYKVPDVKFEYDLKEAAVNMATAAMVSTAMLGFMRFGIGGVLGDLGNVSHGIKTGDWSKLGRSVANSLDGWATTKNGMIVYGNKLSEGRGVLFGNLLDNSMKKIDGRSSASILMNGTRLFGQFDPHIAAKMNLDLVESAEAIKKFEDITGIAGEAAMRGIADADPITVKMFNTVMDKNFLNDNGLTHASVARLFSDYEMAMKREGGGVFPAVKDAAGNILEGAPNQANKVGALLRLVEAHIVDRNIKEYGLSSSDILSEMETITKEKPLLSIDSNFRNFQEIAIHRVGDKAEQSMLDMLSPLLAKQTDPEAEVTFMGRTIPQSVAGNIATKALETKASKTYSKSWRYITNGGTDTDSASFVIAYDPDTGVISKTGRSLEYNPATKQIKTKFEAHADPLYKPERIVSVKEMGAKLKAMQSEVDKVWKDTMKTKLEKLVKEGKVDAEAVKNFTELFEAGKAATPDNIRSIFRLKTKAQATTAHIIMKALGYSEGEDLLRIAKAQKGSISDKATANIVFDASKALIQSTKSSDLGSIVHEMGHYNRLMFLNENGLRDREAIGISEEAWKGFLKWVGNEDDIWINDAKYNELKVKADAGDVDAQAKIKDILKAEEKYTNGFSYYMKSVLKGEGKAPDSAIQRLMHKLGDHLGNIGEMFKTQEALEAGLGMTDEAAMVYSKLLDRSKDKIVDFFDPAYRQVFSKLPSDQRNAIGTHILGEAMWKDYVAKIQKEKAKAKAITDGPIAKDAVPRISKEKLIESIHAELSGGVTKKLIRDAIDAGFTIDDIKTELAKFVDIEKKLFDPKNQLITNYAKKANAVQRNKVVSMLRADPELVKRFTEVTDGTFDVVIDYKVIVKDGKFGDALELVSLDKTTRDKLVAQAKEAPKPKKEKLSKAAKEAGVAAALEALNTPSKIVDERGIPMDLSTTEKAVVTDTAIKHAEGERNIKVAETVAAKVEETVDLNDLLGLSREPSTLLDLVPVPEKIVVKESEPGTLVAEPSVLKAGEYSYTPRPVEVRILEEQLKPISLPEFPIKETEGAGLLTAQLATTAETQQAKATRLGELDAQDSQMKSLLDALREERTAEDRFKVMGETDSTDPELLSLVEQVRQERAQPEDGITVTESILTVDATPELVAKVEEAVAAVAEVVPTVARRKAKPTAPLTQTEAAVVIIAREVQQETGIEATPKTVAVAEPKVEVVEVLENPSATTAQKVEALKKVEQKLEKSSEPVAQTSKQAVTEVRKELESRKVQDMSSNEKRQMQAAVDINEAFWRSFSEGRISASELAEIKEQLKLVTNDYKKDAFFRWVTDHKNKELKTLFYQDAALRRMWSIDPDANSGRMAQILVAMLGIEVKERSVVAEAPVEPQAKAVRKTTLTEQPAPVTEKVVSLPAPVEVRVVEPAADKTKVVEVPAKKEKVKRGDGRKMLKGKVYGESFAFKIRSRVQMVEEQFLESMKAANNTLDELPENAKAVLKKIVAKVRKSGTIEELAEMWKYYLSEEKIEIPRPSHSYIEAELKFVISSEQFANLKGLTAAELRAFVHIRETVEENMHTAVVETALRSPSPENFKRVQDFIGIPAQYMEIYVRAMKQIKAAPDIADFQKAWIYVADHGTEQPELIRFLADNEKRYNEVKETESDKRFVDMYNSKLRERQTFINAELRTKRGIIPEDVADLDIDRAVSIGLWDIADEGSYSRLIEIYMKVASSDKGVNVNLDDILGELSFNKNLQERVAKELGIDGDAASIVKAFIAGEKGYNGNEFSPDGLLAARKYLRRVISRMTLDNDSEGKGTKKRILNVVGTDKQGEAVELGIGHNFRLDTDHFSDVSTINESEFVKQTVSFLYDRLVAEGKTELADYLAARRATATLEGNRQTNLEMAYSRRAKERTGEPVQVTEAFVSKMEKQLAGEMNKLSDELEGLGVSAASIDIIRAGRLNIIDSNKIKAINEAITIREETTKTVAAPAKKNEPFFGEGAAPVRKKAKTSVDPDVITALDQALVDMKTGDKVDLVDIMKQLNTVADPEMKPIIYDIMFGNIKTADQLLDETLKQFDYLNDTNIKVLQLLKNMSGSKEILKNFTIAYNPAKGLTAYVHHYTQVIAFNMETDLSTVVHELVHVFTGNTVNHTHSSLDVGDFPVNEGFLANRKFIKKTVKAMSKKPDMLSNPKFVAVKHLMDTYLKVSDTLIQSRIPTEVLERLNVYYGMTDMHEFLAESVSNPQFRWVLQAANIEVSDVLKSMVGHYDSILSEVTDPTARATMSATLTIMDTIAAQNKKDIKRYGNIYAYKHVLMDDPEFTFDAYNPLRIDIATGDVTTINDLIGLGKNPLRVGHIKSKKVVAELRARADLAAANGRVAKTLNQLREVALQEDTIASAKAAGANSVKELEDQLKKLVDTADVRKRALLDLGYEAEVEPADLAAIRSAMDGHPELIPTGRAALMRSIGPRNATARRTMVSAALAGKSYRSLTDDERRSFVTDVLMPKIEEAIGNRNASAGVFSGVSETKLGKWTNGLIGGGAHYGDTAESGSKGLQFLSKILDPTMDLRDGELNGAFNLFSMDLVNAEKNNAFSRSGLLGLKNKIRAIIKNPDEIDRFNDTAWMYLGKIDELPKDTAHHDLMVEFIKAVHKHNQMMGETLVEYGNLSKEMVPEEYGTIHKVNELAYQDKQGFADALHANFLKKIKSSDEINLVTAEALGWVVIKRESGNTDDIISFVVPERSPLAKIVKPDEVHEWNSANKKQFGNGSASAKLSAEDLKVYRSALDSTENYVESWKNLYSNRGPGYTAIRRSMEIARDRYIGLDLGDSKTGKPRSETPSNTRDRSETRILSHNEIAEDKDLAKYFHKEIYDLIYQQLNHDYTDALMTKHISNYFGTKMSWLDLVHVLGSYGEETMDKANMSLAEITSRRNGYKRMTDVWEAHIGRMQEGKDGVDKYYAALMENSKISVLMAGGLKAAVSSFGEVGKALLASNQHKTPVIQLVSNLKKAVNLAISRGKRDSIKEVASATHWIRGLSADHLLARSEINPSNPFNGLAMGTRNPGFFQRLVADWKQVGKINKAETNSLSRKMNYVGIAAQRLGVPLAYVNDMSTCIHIWNAQENFTRNSEVFLKLAEEIQGRKFTSLSEMEGLAAKCGLRAQEALNLSTAGLLDPDVIRIIRDAAKDQSLYSDGMLDVQKMYRWADGDKAKLNAIDRMGGFINMTARQTNAEPTLLDLRVNQSLFARSMSIFTQFLLTHSVQEIGRRRRYSTTNYGVHLGGLMLMELLTYSLIRNRDERGTVQQIEEEPIKFALMNAASLPLYGSYSLWMPVIRAAMTNAYNSATDQNLSETVRFPDLYGAPAETAHIRAYQTIEEMLGK